MVQCISNRNKGEFKQREIDIIAESMCACSCRCPHCRRYYIKLNKLTMEAMFNFTQLSFILRRRVLFNVRGHAPQYHYLNYFFIFLNTCAVPWFSPWSQSGYWLTQTFSPAHPLSHNLNNPDILIQELSNRLLNLHKTYPGRFNILSVEFFLTFNYFPNF